MNALKSLLLVGLLMLLAVPMSLTAQVTYEEACELASFNDEIDRVLAEYLATRQIDVSSDGAVASVQALQTELDELATACLEAQRDVRMDELDTLLTELQAGGLIVYVRHTHTDRVGSGDTDRAGCENERNLSTRGRDEAQFINEQYVQLDLPVNQLISTELCRALDTAELAFGAPDTIIVRSELENTLADVLTIIPPDGTNTIIVAHIGTLNRNFGLPIPFDEGDSYVFRPMGDDGFELVGRISLLDWEVLAEINASR